MTSKGIDVKDKFGTKFNEMLEHPAALLTSILRLRKMNIENWKKFEKNTEFIIFSM